MRVLRYGGCDCRGAEAGRAGDAAEAFAGFAYAGGEFAGGGAAAASGGAEWQRRLWGEGAGDAGDFCGSGGALWVVCGELWVGAAEDGAAAGAGLRDWRRCGGTAAGGGGDGAVCGE